MLILSALLAVQAPPPVYGPPPPPPRVAIPLTAQPARSRAPMQSYITNEDYPYPALAGRQEGTVRYRLAIDPEGAITGCTIRQSSGHEALDAATCDLLGRRARFSAALGASGRPVAGYYDGAVRWQLPANFIAPPSVELVAAPADGLIPPRPLAPLGAAFGSQDYPPGMATRPQAAPTVVRLDIGANGRVVGCIPAAAAGAADLVALACRLLTERARFDPARTGAGEARPASLTARIAWPPPAAPAQ